MRTTVTLDTDVQVLLKKAMHKRDASFKQTLNDAIRAGLNPPRQRATSADTFDFSAYRMGEPLVDLTKANALAGELEDQEAIARMQRRR
ncbi:MAG: hypothetical protein LH480_10145 [Rubrivivax sp.]|nr:hypothetical protein [Rubrivivax sp.]